MLTLRRSQSSCKRSLGAPAATGLLRLVPALLLVTLLGGSLASCTAPGDVDNADNNVILVIEAIAPSESGAGEGAGGDDEEITFGDVITSGGIIDDAIDVSLAAVLKAPITTDPSVIRPDLQNIALDRYEVTFTRTDGGTAVPPGFTRGIAGIVRLSQPGTDQVTLTTIEGLVIMPSTTKAQPPISFLISPGIEPGTNFTNIQVNARIQFFGRTLAGHDVTVVGNMGINFADYGGSSQ